MPTTAFTCYASHDAPESSRARVRAAEKSFGFVPRPVGLMAESPELLDGFLTLNGIFEKCSLARLEREVLTLTVATRIGCHYCVAMHSAILTRSGADAGLVSALREEVPLPDRRLEALRRFTLHVMDVNGAVSDEELEAFFCAGYTRRSALDVVLGLGAYTLSTAANRMTRAELDPPFEPFAWHRR